MALAVRVGRCGFLTCKHFPVTCALFQKHLSVSCSDSSGGSGSDSKNRKTCSKYLKVNMKRLPLVCVPQANFHQQSIIQFHIQTTRGILLEALQKSRVATGDIRDLNLRIPDEFKRLRQGSLRWLFEAWPSPKKSFSALTQIQNFLNAEALKTGTSPPKFSRQRQKNDNNINEEQLHLILDYIHSKNIAVRRLLKLPWLLTADPVVLEEAVKRVQRYLKLEEFHVAVSFVNVKDMKLKEAASLWRKEAEMFWKQHECDGGKGPLFENRLDFMADRLKCRREDAADMMAKVNNLMTMRLEHVETIIDCLLEGGINPEAIVSDPWVFIHNVDTMKMRLQEIKAKGIREFKPWILRSSQRIFERFIAAELKEMELLGDKDIQSFLQEKLRCDKRAASRILIRVPSVKTATASKLNEMIEFLYSEGFTSEHILETPRILGHSVDTISDRLKQIGEHEKVENLHLLCRTSREYQKFLRKLQEENFIEPISISGGSAGSKKVSI